MTSFNKFIIKKHLKTSVFGKNIYYFKSIDSTNSFAKESPLKKGDLVIAENQTCGRGRKGKSFISNKGGIYFSAIWETEENFDAGVITTLSAIATAKAIDKIYGIETKIKWVNDIYYMHKKICGILCEKSEDKIIIGIGVNVNSQKFPEDIKNIADSLLNLTHKRLNPQKLCTEIINNLEKLLMENSLSEHMDFLKNRSIVLGREIKVLSPKGEYFATALDISSSGELIIESNGEKSILGFGEISLKI